MKSEFERQFAWKWRQQKLMAAAAGTVQAVGKRLAAVHSVVGKRGYSYRQKLFFLPHRSFSSIAYLNSTF